MVRSILCCRLAHDLGYTVYQVEPSALALLKTYGTKSWSVQLKQSLRAEREFVQNLNDIETFLEFRLNSLDGNEITLSPGGQNPLIKSVVEDFCPRFTPGATVTYIGDAENRFLHLDAAYLKGIGVLLAPAAKNARRRGA
jgi:hypothetical protein